MKIDTNTVALDPNQTLSEALVQVRAVRSQAKLPARQTQEAGGQPSAGCRDASVHDLASRIGEGLLAVLEPGIRYKPAQIARRLRCSESSLRRTLHNLLNSGSVKTEQQGNLQVYWRPTETELEQARLRLERSVLFAKPLADYDKGIEIFKNLCLLTRKV
ncbi:hypothetical protein HT746_00890 [Burkholderia pyrrocinia]|uniref:hypothetical protein n=1 Tax=Burkholderia pyrrocinia TaxID=60550 RepID=UPI0015759A8E|nr:hypothetical protein [Burkholderia pyrrocinia]NTX25719.1 hypothetical protein [Burkholderia pyrrocinia]